MTSVIDTTDPKEAWRKGLSGLLDFACATHARAIACLIVLSIVAFLPGFAKMPVMDRDEARYAQATKQMLATGDFVDIRFQNEVRYKKPVGIYWMQAISVSAYKALGRRNVETRISAYRMPSLIGAIGAVLLTYWAALAFISRRAAMLAAVMMAASILLGAEARLAKTDAMLLATCIAAMGVMARVYLGRTEGWPGWHGRFLMPLVFWGALGLGVLIKGPLILLFVGLPALTLSILDRSVRWMAGLKPLIGIAIFLAIVLPWFVAIWGRSGAAFFAQSAGDDLLSKIFSGQESHGAPPGYYFILFFLTFWPAALLAGLATPAVWRARREPPIKFLLAWIVPAWIVFELVMTKLPHYVLPLYPAIAILLAGCIDTKRLGTTRWMEWGTFWWFAVPAFAMIAALTLSLGYEADFAWRAWPFMTAAIIFGFRAWWLYDVDGAERAILRSSAASILLAAAMYWSVIPGLVSLFPSHAVSHAVRSTDCVAYQVASVSFREPSLVFLVGTDTRFVDAVGAADFLAASPCRFAVVDTAQDRTFARRAEIIGLRYRRIAEFKGMSLGSGSRVSFAVYSSR